MSTTILSESQIKELFKSACEHHQKGNLEEAKFIYKTLLDSFPTAFLLNYNIALIYYEEENFVVARSHYENASIDCPDNPDLLFNLGLCYKKLNLHNKAIEVFLKSLEIQDENIDTLYNLAACLREIGNWQATEKTYLQVLNIDPDYLPAMSNLAYTYHRLGKQDEALTLYKRVIAKNPSHFSARHMVSSLSQTTLTHTELGYVQELFDDYSESFEEDLTTNLQYKVPMLINQELKKVIKPTQIFDNVLDVGCGTGLAGTYLQDICNYISGVDIAAKMVEKAREKNIYEELVASDINEFLQNGKGGYDLIVAADVFSYIGGLEETIENIVQKSLPGALLCFSIESPIVELEEEKGFQLETTGRFTHSEDYIKNVTKNNGLRLVKQSSVQLRQEAGKWVLGWIFIYVKM